MQILHTWGVSFPPGLRRMPGSDLAFRPTPLVSIRADKDGTADRVSTRWPHHSTLKYCLRMGQFGSKPASAVHSFMRH